MASARAPASQRESYFSRRRCERQRGTVLGRLVRRYEMENCRPRVFMQLFHSEEGSSTTAAAAAAAGKRAARGRLPPV